MVVSKVAPWLKQRRHTSPGPEDFWFLPLGGCGEIGANLNLYGIDDQWLMVDCGIGFERDQVGQRVFYPDTRFIEARRDTLQALIVTHAHEDHVGAVAYLWPKLRCPVYTTAFTAEVLKRKLAEQGLLDSVPLHIVDREASLNLGPFSVTWVGVNHSTPESQGLLIETALGRVFHSGDWKLDGRPVLDPVFGEAHFARLRAKPIDYLVCDSTNAMVEGRSTTEGELYKGLKRLVQNAEGRVIVTCFGSNIGRLHTLVKVARACGRYPALLGRSLERFHVAARLSGIWPAELELVPPGHLGYLPEKEVFAVVTGSQGEKGAVLSRLARGAHRAFDVGPGDTVIFSSRVIPGNDIDVDNLVRLLRLKGCHVIQEHECEWPIHASGHPAREELCDMYDWLQPEVLIPVHGEGAHLEAQAALGRAHGIQKGLQGLNGDIFTLYPYPGIRRGAVPVGRIYRPD
jgi:ribonuclease J